MRKLDSNNIILRFNTCKDAPMEAVCQALGIPHSTQHHQHCPLPRHPDDNTPSFKYYLNNSFACFGCREGGSPVDLVMKVRNLRSIEAVIWIERAVLRTYKLSGGPGRLTVSLQNLHTRLQLKFDTTKDHTFDPIEFRTLLGEHTRRQLNALKAECSEITAHQLATVDETAEHLYGTVDLLGSLSSRSECLAAELEIGAILQLLKDTVTRPVQDVEGSLAEPSHEQPEGRQWRGL